MYREKTNKFNGLKNYFRRLRFGGGFCPCVLCNAAYLQFVAAFRDAARPIGRFLPIYLFAAGFGPRRFSFCGVQMQLFGGFAKQKVKHAGA